jgi:TRAP-type uncharacterized transport system substrate-binding protein
MYTNLLDLFDRIDKTLAFLRAQREEEDGTDAEALLGDTLERLQRYAWLRKLLAIVVVIGLLAAMTYFVWGLLPRSYHLTISGGDILSNRHQLAVAMRDEGAGAGMNLVVRPISGTFDILNAVNEKKIDVALIQGGLDASLPNIRHVARVLPETLHLLVQDDINSLQDLKGKIINLGSAHGGTRVIGEQVLAFSELRLGIDYAPSTHSAEELLALPERKMPSAVFNISTVPSFLAEELIKHRGYKLLEIPFPKALAMRHGWVADAELLPFTYKTNPPVPDKKIVSLGVNLFMVCNKDVPDMAVLRLLDVLYSVGVGNVMRTTIDPAAISMPSGYAHSGGTELFLKRNEPLFSEENVERFKAMIGLLMSSVTFLVMGLRWLRGRGENRLAVEREFRGYVRLAAQCNETLLQLEIGPGVAPEEREQCFRRMASLKAALLARLSQVKTLDNNLASLLVQGLVMAEGTLARLTTNGQERG